MDSCNKPCINSFPMIQLTFWHDDAGIISETFTHDEVSRFMTKTMEREYARYRIVATNDFTSRYKFEVHLKKSWLCFSWWSAVAGYKTFEFAKACIAERVARTAKL